MIEIKCPKCKSKNVVKVFTDFGWEYKCRVCGFSDEYDYFARKVEEDVDKN